MFPSRLPTVYNSSIMGLGTMPSAEEKLAANLFPDVESSLKTLTLPSLNIAMLYNIFTGVQGIYGGRPGLHRDLDEGQGVIYLSVPQRRQLMPSAAPWQQWWPQRHLWQRFIPQHHRSWGAAARSAPCTSNNKGRVFRFKMFTIPIIISLSLRRHSHRPLTE